MAQLAVGPTGTFKGFTRTDAPAEAGLYRCVHCGFCLAVCPTYLETGLEAESPRGRLALMKAVNEGRLRLTAAVVGHWDLCLQCRACEEVCPSQVPYGPLMEATRAQVEQQFRRTIQERLARVAGYRGVLPHSGRLRAAGHALRLYQRSGLQRAVRASGILKVLPGNLDHMEASLPELKDAFFSAQGRLFRPRGLPRARVALLSGCVMPMTHGPTMEAVVRVLTRNGIEVHVPAGQGCCGALNVHAGELESAREMARRNIDAFLEVEPDAIITASAGCGSTMKEYGELLRDDPHYSSRAEQVASLTKDIHEYLVELPFEPPRAAMNLRVTYQDACHLAHAQRIREAPRRILRSIPGVEFVELPEADVCCGSAGTYSLTQRDMSGRLGRRKVANVKSTGAAVMATGNPGCAMHIAGQLCTHGEQTTVMYVVDLLAEAYGREEAAR
ncbi:MAG: 4Fe-4S dicluster domain-containing protein, partial [Gemmatimonadetes bacterium]|nr:4Fe-4S dicluster domain-containing protein [Gemmatimonadota bacterium]